MVFILYPTDYAKTLSRKKVIVCDHPDGCLAIMHEGTLLSYRTFDTLWSVHRTKVVENKRLDDILSVVAEMQEGRERHRRQNGASRAGQKDHMFGIQDCSVSNSYRKRGRKPGRRTNFVNDPEVNAKRQKALARTEAAE